MNTLNEIYNYVHEFLLFAEVADNAVDACQHEGTEVVERLASTVLFNTIAFGLDTAGTLTKNAETSLDVQKDLKISQVFAEMAFGVSKLIYTGIDLDENTPANVKKTPTYAAMTIITVIERICRVSFETQSLQAQINIASHTQEQAYEKELATTEHVLEIINDIEPILLLEPLLSNPAYGRYLRWLLGVEARVEAPVAAARAVPQPALTQALRPGL